MNPLRHHIQRHRWWAAALIVAALLIEILVPAGYMPTVTNGAFLMRPCAGQDAPFAMAAASGASDSTAHGDHDHRHDPEGGDHGKLEAPCVFSSLSAPVLGAIDPALLAIAIAFTLATSFHLEEKVAPARSLHLRPPSQGPPLT